MTNTQINVDELLDMFKKADEIAKNDLFVDSERNVYKKSATPMIGNTTIIFHLYTIMQNALLIRI